MDGSYGQNILKKEVAEMKDRELINIIAEQLINEFPDVKIENVYEKAGRLGKRVGTK